MTEMKTGRNGWYKVIQTKNGPVAMYKSTDVEEFIEDRKNPTLRAYLNYTNLYDASGIVAITISTYRLVPSNVYHLRFLLHKIQLEIFGNSDFPALVISTEEYEKLQEKEALSGEELALKTLYKIDQEFQKGEVMEECCNIGGKIEFHDFITLFWVYEMLLEKAKGKLEIQNDKEIESLKYEEFIQKYPGLEVVNLFGITKYFVNQI